jgi:hypothetical protein
VASPIALNDENGEPATRATAAVDALLAVVAHGCNAVGGGLRTACSGLLALSPRLRRAAIDAGAISALSAAVHACASLTNTHPLCVALATLGAFLESNGGAATPSDAACCTAVVRALSLHGRADCLVASMACNSLQLLVSTRALPESAYADTVKPVIDSLSAHSTDAAVVSRACAALERIACASCAAFAGEGSTVAINALVQLLGAHVADTFTARHACAAICAVVLCSVGSSAVAFTASPSFVSAASSVPCLFTVLDAHPLDPLVIAPACTALLRIASFAALPCFGGEVAPLLGGALSRVQSSVDRCGLLPAERIQISAASLPKLSEANVSEDCVSINSSRVLP